MQLLKWVNILAAATLKLWTHSCFSSYNIYYSEMDHLFIHENVKGIMFI